MRGLNKLTDQIDKIKPVNYYIINNLRDISSNDKSQQTKFLKTTISSPLLSRTHTNKSCSFLVEWKLRRFLLPS